MEYLVGSLVTLFTIYIFAMLQGKKVVKVDRFTYRQSHIHELIKPLLPKDINKRHKDSQSYKHERETNVRVIILDNSAYWVKNNMFYMADMVENSIDKDSTRIVDTMGMDKVQLDKMLFIMDRLTDGENNDRGSAGNE